MMSPSSVLPFSFSLIALVLCVLEVKGENSNGSYNATCNSKALDECWAKLPSMKEPHIPINSKEVETACKAFQMGMNCVDDYAKKCLHPKSRGQLKDSIRGAHEAFSFLCTDPRFRAEFLSHAACYKKISKPWDGCAEKFIAALQKATNKEKLATCCIRRRFIQCVGQLVNLQCGKDAESFLLKMAETLVTSKIKKEAECFDIVEANCTNSSWDSSSRASSLHTSLNFDKLISFLVYIPKEMGITGFNLREIGERITSFIM